MEFRFSGETPVGRECRLLLREEVEGAVSQLAHFAENPDLAIHETRRHNKRIRGVILLTRPVLDSGDIATANRLIRDAARLFSHERDALVLQESCDALALHFTDGKTDAPFNEVRSALKRRHDHLMADESLPVRVDGATDNFIEAGRLLESWDWDQVDLDVVFSAVVSNYNLGFGDYEKARASRDPEECHDWRKRVKSLSVHLALLTALDPAWMGEWALATEALASCLGTHHDLAVLESALGEGSTLGISASSARYLISLSEKRRAELEEVAFAEGPRIYRETPEDLHRTFADLAGVRGEVMGHGTWVMS